MNNEIHQVAMAMEGIQLDPLDPRGRRPLDDVIEAGDPADPIAFDRPRFERGRRDDVLCYDQANGVHFEAKNVLFRDYSVEFGDVDGALSRVTEAYWPLPYKERIKTIMGHVEICAVLTRSARDRHDDDSSSSESSADEEDEEIVFEVTKRFVAVKVNYVDRMDRLRDRHAEDPLKEIAAMQHIGNTHPNVMGIIQALFDGSNLNVVMPYCGNGDLFQLLQESQQSNTETPGMSEGVARFWFRQILNGLHYIHSRGVCHRDLSPENVMIDGIGSVIIDMGMCLRIPYTDPNGSTTNDRHRRPVTDITRGTTKRMITPQGACGKLPYMSPEIYRNRSPFDGGAVDIWTAGTILFCMITGNRSYQRPHNSDPQFYWMTQGLSRLLSDWGVTVSNECLHLLKHMLKIDPRARLTLKEVMNHPWMQQPDTPPTSSSTT